MCTLKWTIHTAKMSNVVQGKILFFSILFLFSGVSNVSCNGTEASFTECQKSFGNATCESGLYASVICTDESPPAEGMSLTPHGAYEVQAMSHQCRPKVMTLRRRWYNVAPMLRSQWNSLRAASTYSVSQFSCKLWILELILHLAVILLMNLFIFLLLIAE